MSNKEFSYSEKVAEVEAVLHKLQQPDVSLEEALELHKKGQVLLAELDDFLQHAEVEVQKHMSKG